MNIDIYAYTNPAFCAVVIRWMAEGYSSRVAALEIQSDQRLPVYWAIVGLILMAPEQIRRELPSKASKSLVRLVQDHPSWIPELNETLDSWALPFWNGVAFAVSRGILSSEAGRLVPTGQMTAPADAFGVEVRRKAIALGKSIANQPDRAILELFGEKEVA